VPSGPFTPARAAVFKAWANMLGTTAGYRTSDLITEAMAHQNAALREALLTIAAARSGPHPIDAVRLGRWLLRNDPAGFASRSSRSASVCRPLDGGQGLVRGDLAR
jgi:hypothetical protein